MSQLAIITVANNVSKQNSGIHDDCASQREYTETHAVQSQYEMHASRNYRIQQQARMQAWET